MDVTDGQEPFRRSGFKAISCFNRKILVSFKPVFLLFIVLMASGWLTSSCGNPPSPARPGEPPPPVVETKKREVDPVGSLFDPQLADGFDFPIGDVDGKGKYTAADGRVFSGWYVAAGFAQTYELGIHTGEDWNGNGGGDSDLGQPVFATARGKVLFAGAAAKPYGNIVLIEHRYFRNGRVERVFSQYDHLRDVFVKKDQLVGRRERIGTIGKGADDVFPAHLHFELRRESMADVPVEFWPSSAGWTVEKVRQHYENPTPFILEHRKLIIPAEEPAFLVVVKSRTQMDLFKQGRKVKTWEIGLSQSPDGHKFAEGDRKMPEGAYRIVEKSRGPFKGEWWTAYLGAAWMRLSYPNAEDARTAFAAGRISKAEHDAIVAADRAGKTPPQKTVLGGGIGIHGWIEKEWSDNDSRSLTWGCVSMHNAELKAMYDEVPVGTVVVILP